MNHFATIEEARATAPAEARYIIEIEHATEGRRFIRTTVHLDALKAALARKPIAEIKRLIAQHNIKTAEQIAAERDKALATNCKCERCRAHVDGRTAYSQTEWTRLGGTPVKVIAYYCDRCRSYLSATGELAEKQTDVPSCEPATKGDY